MAYRSFSFIPTLSNHSLSDRFTQMDNLFSRLTGETPVSDTPVYNLLQKDKIHYELQVNVPGYNQNELDISVLNNQLTIIGNPKNKEITSSNEKNDIKWLHHGIEKRKFSFCLNLEHRITIHKANLDKGLLTLQFIYDIPEQEKPQKITISEHNKSLSALENNNI
ncbi:MAG: Hsp20 family protein [Arsenophonus endosymbiont of Ceratovacuna japonica]